MSARRRTSVGAVTAARSPETSIALAAWNVARATAGVVAFRNDAAARRPASPTDQPIQAWAAESTKTLQSRSMRLSNACVSGALIASHPREDPPNNTRQLTRSGWSAAYAMACVHEL